MDAPPRAGIREAKAHFSEIIQIVARGGEYVITDRGKPVARITPATTAGFTPEERLAELERDGLITRSKGRCVHDFTPVDIGPEGARPFLEEDRSARG